MKKTEKKLKLSAETIRTLSNAEMRGVAGGAGTHHNCYATTAITCGCTLIECPPNYTKGAKCVDNTTI